MLIRMTRYYSVRRSGVSFYSFTASDSKVGLIVGVVIAVVVIVVLIIIILFLLYR